MIKEKSFYMRWGKYKNFEISKIPHSYLIWLWDEWGIENSGELHRQLREYIRKNLSELRKSK